MLVNPTYNNRESWLSISCKTRSYFGTKSIYFFIYYSLQAHTGDNIKPQKMLRRLVQSWVNFHLWLTSRVGERALLVRLLFFGFRKSFGADAMEAPTLSDTKKIKLIRPQGKPSSSRFLSAAGQFMSFWDSPYRIILSKIHDIFLTTVSTIFEMRKLKKS